MKFNRTLQLFAIALMITFAACKSKPQDMITKKWAMDITETKKYLVIQAEKVKKENPNLAKLVDEELGKFEKEAANAKMSLEFKKDGTMETLFSGNKEQATWSMSEDGKSITKTEKDGRKSKAQVVELNKNKLVLKIEGADEADSQTMAFTAEK